MLSSLRSKLRPRRLAVVGLLAGGLMFAASGCTIEQIQAFSTITQPTRDAAIAKGLTNERLAQLRFCESIGMYDYVSPGGAYHGAYQFTQGVWDLTAQRHFPWLAGRAPETVEFYWQDAMARALWSTDGPAPWPECGFPGSWCAPQNCMPAKP
jgi:hypothetical protein